MKKHTTHFDDCGCLADKKDKEILSLLKELDILEEKHEKQIEALNRFEIRLCEWEKALKNYKKMCSKFKK